MKISVSTLVVLSACCCLTNGWWSNWSPRRTDYPRFPSFSRHVFSSPSGRTTFHYGDEDNDDYFRTWAGIDHEADNWNSSIRGSIDSDGTYAIDAGFSMEFRKRSAEWNGNHYNITLYVDPCHFDTYDYDHDGAIQMEEIYAIFGKNKKANSLFADLDVASGDGVIELEEFYAMAPMIIAECQSNDEE